MKRAQKKPENRGLAFLLNARLLAKQTGLFDHVESEFLLCFSLLSIFVGVGFAAWVAEANTLAYDLLAYKILLLFGMLSIVLLISAVLFVWRKERHVKPPKNWLD